MEANFSAFWPRSERNPIIFAKRYRENPPLLQRQTVSRTDTNYRLPPASPRLHGRGRDMVLVYDSTLTLNAEKAQRHSP
jgi:hypothetical protein